MHSDAASLLRLQELDLSIMRLKNEIASMPEITRLAEIQLAEKRVSSELRAIVGQRKDIETDIEDNLAHKDEKLQVIAQVQAKAEAPDVNYRQIADFELQVSLATKQIDKLDFERCAREDKLAKAQLAETNARVIAEKLISAKKETAKSFEARKEDLSAKLEELSAERAELATAIADTLLVQYTQAQERFGGLAIECLTGNMPSICRIKLQPAQFSDIRKDGRGIVECPYCHRMLIVDDVFEVKE